MLRAVAKLAIRTAINQSRVDGPKLTNSDGATIDWPAGAIGQLRTEATNPNGGTVFQVIDEATTLIVFAKPLAGYVPAVGDSVEFKCDGQLRKFVVTQFKPEPAYRWTDPYRIGIRIHLKELD